jgi:hypothetical protein
MAGAASRKVLEEVRVSLLKAAALAASFEDANESFERACGLPPIERSNETSKEKRRTSKAVAHSTPQRERCFNLLCDEQKKVGRLRQTLLGFEAEALARDRWPEVLAARSSLDRCLEAHRAAVQANKAKAFSKATLELDE